MKIKVLCEAADQIEGKVNPWLAENTSTKEIEIVNMFHATSTVSDTIYVTVTYIYRELVSPATDATPAKYE